MAAAKSGAGGCDSGGESGPGVFSKFPLKFQLLGTLLPTAPVFHGDTLTAYSEVIAKRDADRDDAGVVRFRHWGVKHDGTIVFEGEREVLLKRRSHWGRAAPDGGGR